MKREDILFFRLALLFVLIGMAVMAWAQIKNASITNQTRHEYSDVDSVLNPWRGLPGCLYMAGGKSVVPIEFGARSRLSCQSRKDMKGIAPSAVHLGSHLENALTWLNAPPNANPAYVEDENKANFIVFPSGRRVTRGGDVALTLDAEAQARGENLVACMTGKTEACKPLGIDPKPWKNMRENAAVRSVALLQLDIATGEIEVMASAGSRCFEKDVEERQPKFNVRMGAKLGVSILNAREALHALGVGAGVKLGFERGFERGKDECIRVPHVATYAYYGDDNLVLGQNLSPASTNKPWLSLALLRAGSPYFDAKRDRQWLFYNLKKSLTTAFIPKILCDGKTSATPCKPHQNLVASAVDLGWNAEPRHRDLLAFEGKAEGEGQLKIATPQIYMMPVGRDKDRNYIWKSFPFSPVPQKSLDDCRDKSWKGCGEPGLGFINELWGEGDSSANVVGIADSYGRLARAANGEPRGFYPHLLKRIENGETIRADKQNSFPLNIENNHARLILQALGETHKTGTGSTACTKVFKEACRMLFISMKTGTPGSRRLPINWSVILTRADNKANAPYNKAIVVLSERNYFLKGGDARANISAEVAFRFLKTGQPF
ncbi:hypothetical protein AGMMS50289_04170 [Betaproteobacteria bacterium]|nr:hypothetical protein AGMMS50289_04170 [Betaproteobacteria bacterium]